MFVLVWRVSVEKSDVKAGERLEILLFAESGATLQASHVSLKGHWCDIKEP